MIHQGFLPCLAARALAVAKPVGTCIAQFTMVSILAVSLSLGLAVHSQAAAAAPEEITAALPGPSKRVAVIRSSEDYVIYNTASPSTPTAPASFKGTDLEPYASEITAAFTYQGNDLFILSSGNIIAWDGIKSVILSGPAPIANALPNLSPYAVSIDAALNLGGDKVMFFLSNGQNLQYDLPKDQIDAGYPKAYSASNFAGLQSHSRDVRAAVKWDDNWAVIFLSNGKFLNYNLNTKKTEPIKNVANSYFKQATATGSSSGAPNTPPPGGITTPPPGGVASPPPGGPTILPPTATNPAIAPAKPTFLNKELIRVNVRNLSPEDYFVTLSKGSNTLQTKLINSKKRTAPVTFKGVAPGSYIARLIRVKGGVAQGQTAIIVKPRPTTPSSPANTNPSGAAFVQTILGPVRTATLARGFTHIDNKKGTLANGANQTVPLRTFKAGVSYSVTITGDSPNAMLDLAMIDGNGNRIYSETVTKAPFTKYVEFTPPSDQFYSLYVTMIKCDRAPCHWGATILQAPANGGATIKQPVGKKPAVATPQPQPQPNSPVQLTPPQVSFDNANQMATFTVGGLVQNRGQQNGTLLVRFEVFYNGQWILVESGDNPAFSVEGGRYSATLRQLRVPSNAFQLGTLPLALRYDDFGFEDSDPDERYQVRATAQLWLEGKVVAQSQSAPFSFNY